MNSAEIHNLIETLRATVVDERAWVDKRTVLDAALQLEAQLPVLENLAAYKDHPQRFLDFPLVRSVIDLIHSAQRVLRPSTPEASPVGFCMRPFNLVGAMGMRRLICTRHAGHSGDCEGSHER